eukprot:505472_1
MNSTNKTSGMIRVTSKRMATFSRDLPPTTMRPIPKWTFPRSAATKKTKSAPKKTQNCGAQREKKAKQQKHGVYMDPALLGRKRKAISLGAASKGKRGQSKMARAKPSPRTQPVAEFSRAVRTSTKVRTQRVAQEQNAWEKLKKGRRRGKRRKARVFSQAELMAEARVTEFRNARSLKEMLAREEKKKKVVIKKKKIVGAFMRYHSTRRPRTFTFVGSPCEAIVAFPKETQSEPYPSSTKCAITGQPAKYFDPRTREPFATADAFRQLRCMADEGSVPAFKQHGARSLIVCLRLPAGWRSRLPVRVRKSVVKSEPVYFSQQPVSSQQPASSQQPMSSQQPVSSQQPLIDDGVPRWRVVGVGCDDFLRYTIRLRRVLPMFVPVPPVSHPVASRQGIFGTDNFGPLPSSTGMGSPAQQLLLPPLANFMKPLPIPNFSLNSMMNAGSTDLPPPPMVGRQYTKRSNVTESGLLTLVPGHRMGHQANNIPVSQGLSHNKSAPR